LPVPGERRLAPDHGIDLPVDGGWPCSRRDDDRSRSDYPLRPGRQPDSVIEASVAIKDGRVIRVANDAVMPQAAETLDARGLHVLPGAIDDHVHFRDPVIPTRRISPAVRRRQRSAASPTVFDMPRNDSANRYPRSSPPAQMAVEKAHVDSGFMRCSAKTPSSTCLNWPRAPRFKLYMGNTFGAIPSPDTGAMLEAFEVVARPHSAFLSMPRPTRSWCGVNCGCVASGASIPRPHRVAGRSGRGRGVSRAASSPSGRRAHPHPAHLVRRELPSLREAKARGVDITENLPALRAALDR